LFYIALIIYKSNNYYPNLCDLCVRISDANVNDCENGGRLGASAFRAAHVLRQAREDFVSVRRPDQN